MRSQGQGFPDFVDDRKRLHTVDGSRMPTLESLEGYFLCVYEEEAEEEQSSEIEMPMPMSESGDDSDDSSGSGSGDSSDDSSGESSDDSSGESSDDSSGDSSGESSDDSSGDSSGSDDSDQLNGHKSGSSGDGKPREWEDGEPQDTFGQERLDDGCQDEEMKEAVQDAVKKVASKGCGSSDVARIVEKAMEVQFDPQAALQSVIASSIEMNSTGQDETTYRRPNHRKSFGGFISPSRVGSDPEVLVVIDTSGSMEQPDFELAYGMLDKCFQELGVEELRVVTGDSELKVDIRVACMSDVKLVGRGGTDMVRVCDQALENDSEPQPDVIICITDGGTDWPNEPYDNCDFIAAITSDLSYHDKEWWLWEEVPEHVEDIWIRS